MIAFYPFACSCILFYSVTIKLPVLLLDSLIKSNHINPNDWWVWWWGARALCWCWWSCIPPSIHPSIWWDEMIQNQNCSTIAVELSIWISLLWTSPSSCTLSERDVERDRGQLQCLCELEGQLDCAMILSLIYLLSLFFLLIQQFLSVTIPVHWFIHKNKKWSRPGAHIHTAMHFSLIKQVYVLLLLQINQRQYIHTCESSESVSFRIWHTLIIC